MVIKIKGKNSSIYSQKNKEASYGTRFVDNVAEFFSNNYPELKGFNRRGLYRMKKIELSCTVDEKLFENNVRL